MKSAVVCLLCLLARLCVSLSPLTQCLQEFVQVHFLPGVLQLWHWQDEEQPLQKMFHWDTNSGHDILNGLTRTEQHTMVIMNEGWRSQRSDVRSDVTQAQSLVIVLDSSSVADNNLLESRLDVCRKHPLWRSQTRLLVVVHRLGDLHPAHTARLVLKKLWETSKAANVVVLVHPKLQFYKWMPYGEDCGEVKNVDLVETWQDGFVQNATLFRGITNLHGCRLLAGTMPNPPYVLPPVPGRGYEEGVDIRIARELQTLFNFSLEWVPYPDTSSPWAALNEHDQPLGFWALIVNQTIDMCLYGFGLSKNPFRIAESMDWYIEDSAVWVVPTPQPIPPWRNLVDAFSSGTWFLQIGTFLFLSLILYFLPGHRSLSSSFLTSWGLHFGQAMRHPRATPARSFMLFTSLCTMLLVSHYVSALAALLHGGRYRPAWTSPLEASQAGVVTYLFPGLKHAYNTSDYELWNQIFKPGMYIYSENYYENLRIMDRDKTGMTILAHNSAEYIIKTQYTNQLGISSLKFLRQKYGVYKVTMYLSRGHPMAEFFRTKINQLVSSGIVQRWQKEVSSSNKDVFTDSTADAHSALTVEHLSGAFWILLIMLALSLVCFLFEFLTAWHHNRGLVKIIRPLPQGEGKRVSLGLLKPLRLLVKE